MRLTAFRIQNYKKIRDTGWISLGDLIAFVGKNEAGKSALFRGLSKLNPSDGQKYDGLKEFPRRRFTDEFKNQDWPVASGDFVLDNTEKEEFTTKFSELSNIEHVKCTRHYSWKLTTEFEPLPSISDISRSEFELALKKAKMIQTDNNSCVTADDFLKKIEKLLKQQENKQSDEVVPISEIEELLTLLNNKSAEFGQIEEFSSILDNVKGMQRRSLLNQQIRAAKIWVQDNLPKFIYFDNYDVIDSAIHLPTFVQQLSNNPTQPRVRTTRCLFEYVGLDIRKLASLGNHTPSQSQNDEIRRMIDERAIYLSSASSAMTKKFEDWWEQRHHKFHYQADGDYFRIWVSDDLDPSEVELDQRSLGMQYFFSFFTVFLVESQGAHKRSILLLDEPGLHMHGTAQGKVVKFLEKLSNENQTFYTTHSPFMIDGDHLERVRIVYEDKEGTTKVSEDVWPKDKDALFPLQAGLGYQIVQSLFISKKQLIVEGITDYWILKALDHALPLKQMPDLSDDIVIVPAGGVGKLLPLASMLIGHDIDIVALLDGDEPGRKEGKKLSENLLSGKPGHCLFVADFVANTEAQLEDIFPENIYLSAVAEAYKLDPILLSGEENQLQGIIKKTQAFFNRKNIGKFEKWRPAAILRDWIISEDPRIPNEVFATASKMFQQINSAFDKLGS